MTRGTRERLRSTGLAPDGPITRSDSRYRYLTLDYPELTRWEGRWYHTIEHVILAAALEHDEDRRVIASCGTVRRARSMFNVLAIHRSRHGWMTRDMQRLVEQLLRERFKSASLREHFIGTYPAPIRIEPQWYSVLLEQLRNEYRIGRE